MDHACYLMMCDGLSGVLCNEHVNWQPVPSGQNMQMADDGCMVAAIPNASPLAVIQGTSM